MDFDALAKSFSDFYYSTFDTDRSQLANLYVSPSAPPRPLHDSTANVYSAHRVSSLLSLQSLPVENR